MAVVRLRAPLSELAGGKRELELDGSTVGEVLGRSSGASRRKGWILDERGTIREHINVFVNKDIRTGGHGGRRRRSAAHPPRDLGRMR